MVHLMIDIETLGTRNNSPILSIAAVPFDPKTGKCYSNIFYEKIDISSYDNTPFQLNFSTLKWWLSQSEKARTEAFSGVKSIDKVIKEFHKYLTGMGKIYPWSHGKDFDLPILENAFSVFSLETPWKFWDTLDTRTIYYAHNINLKNIKMEKMTKHNALHDCYLQIKGIELAKI